MTVTESTVLICALAISFSSHVGAQLYRSFRDIRTVWNDPSVPYKYLTCRLVFCARSAAKELACGLIYFVAKLGPGEI